MPTDSPGYLAACQVFMRLGQGLLGTEQAKADRAAFEQAQTEVEELRTRLRALAAELSEQWAFGEAEAKNAQLPESQEKYKAFYEHNEALKAQVAGLRDVKQKLERDLETRRSDIAALNADFEERLAEAESNAEKLRAHRDALLNSTSWKITAPARRLIDVARGGGPKSHGVFQRLVRPAQLQPGVPKLMASSGDGATIVENLTGGVPGLSLS